MEEFNFNSHVFEEQGSGINQESEQHSLDWYRARLGNFTGSRISELLVSSRSKDETFGQTALSYIYEVAAERDMHPKVVNDDDLFLEWLEQKDTPNKYMQWGTAQEPIARQLYAKKTGYEIIERGSVKHPTIPYFASSPDGFIEAPEGCGCLEIKCPTQKTFMQYLAEIKTAEDLKKVKKEYYYQCQGHMMCTGAVWCDFVAFSPFQKRERNMIIVRVLPNAEDIALLEERILLANSYIDERLLKA